MLPFYQKNEADDLQEDWAACVEMRNATKSQKHKHSPTLDPFPSTVPEHQKTIKDCTTVLSQC